jgi:hypothetical protein
MRSLNELVNKTDTTWETIREWISNSINKVEVLPVKDDINQKVLYNTQVSTKSALGAVIYNTGGLLIDNGWLRIIGSGHLKLNRDISTWNQIAPDGKAKLQGGSILVADDVVGGFYAINGGAFSGEIGNVFYLAPDTLEWEDLEMGYADFIKWSFNGNISKFYESFRWNNWEEEVNHLSGNSGILIYPYLWAEGAELNSRSRKIVPIKELWELSQDNRLKLGIT